MPEYPDYHAILDHRHVRSFSGTFQPAPVDHLAREAVAYFTTAAQLGYRHEWGGHPVLTDLLQTCAVIGWSPLAGISTVCAVMQERGCTFPEALSLLKTFHYGQIEQAEQRRELSARLNEGQRVELAEGIHAQRN